MIHRREFLQTCAAGAIAIVGQQICFPRNGGPSL